MEADLSLVSLGWFETWRVAFLHPTVKTFSRIISDRKASIRWGTFWMATAACLAWLLGPLRPVVWGWAANNFGMLSPWSVAATGAVVAPVWGAITLLLGAALAHALARLFQGRGTFRQVVYCWGILPLPFVLLAVLLLQVPWIFPQWRGTSGSTAPIAFTIGKLSAAAIVVLYLTYAQVVAFGAIEGFGAWKAFGVLVLLSFMLGIFGACLSMGSRALLPGTYSW